MAYHAGYLYWVDASDGVIWRSDASDISADPIECVQTNVNAPLDVAVTANEICWTDPGNSSISCTSLDANKMCGAPPSQPSIPNRPGRVHGIAIKP